MNLKWICVLLFVIIIIQIISSNLSCKQDDWIKNFNNKLFDLGTVIDPKFTINDLSSDNVHLNYDGGTKVVNVINSIFSNGNNVLVIGDSHSNNQGSIFSNYSQWFNRSNLKNATNLAISGHTAEDQYNYIDFWNMPHGIKKVLIFVGTNDMRVGNSVNYAISSYKNLINKIKEFANDAHIYIVKIPPTGNTGWLCNL